MFFPPMALKVMVAGLVAVGFLVVPANASREEHNEVLQSLAAHIERDPSSGGNQTICVVSANQPVGGGKIAEVAFKGFASACLATNSNTDIVALLLQDFPGESIPKYLEDLPVKNGGRHFKLRHQLVGETDGSGKVCYIHFNGGFVAGAITGGVLGAKVGALAKGWGAIPGLLIGALGGGIAGKFTSSAAGVNCGGVAIVVYSLRKVKPGFDLKATDSWKYVKSSVTATTKKGTMAARLEINGRHVVIASTHGSEGVRGKKRGTSCPAGPAQTEKEKQLETVQKKSEHMRVNDFRGGLEAITLLRGGDPANSKVAALWGGDFNHRAVNLSTGCAAFPKPANESADSGNARELDKLERSRDVLGGDPNHTGLATFSGELRAQASDMAEFRGLRCPTYKKGEVDGEPHYTCVENGETMHYLNSHPPSWTDRIYHSTAPDWLTCGNLQRLAHPDDHDALLVTCDISCGRGLQ